MTSRKSSGSRRVASSVEPTRSQNITVSCRRSALVGAGVSRTIVSAMTGAWVPSAAIASSNRRRWPIGTTPISLRSSDVRLGSTLSSISFTRNAGSYCSSPRAWSHAAMSTLASPTRSMPRSYRTPKLSLCTNTGWALSRPKVMRCIIAAIGVIIGSSAARARARTLTRSSRAFVVAAG